MTGPRKAGWLRGWTACLMASLIAVSVALCLLLASRTALADAVALRVNSTSEFIRLSLQWPRAVVYNMAVTDGRLVLNFDRVIEPNLSAGLGPLASYVADPRVGPDGRSLSFALRRAQDIKTFSEGNAVVVDFFPDGPFGPQPAPAASTPAAPGAGTPTAGGDLTAVPVRTGSHPDYNRVVFDWNRPVDYTLDRNAGQISINFSAGGRIDTSTATLSQVPHIGGIVAGAADAGRSSAQLSIPPTARMRHFRVGNKVVVDVFNPPAGSPPAAPLAAPPPAPVPTPVQSAAASPPVPTPPATQTPAPSPAQPVAAAPSAAPPAVPPAMPASTPPVAAAPPAALPAASTAATLPTPPPAATAPAAEIVPRAAPSGGALPPETPVAPPVANPPAVASATEPPPAATPAQTPGTQQNTQMQRLEQMEAAAGLRDDVQPMNIDGVSLLTLNAGQPAGLAVFERGNHLYFVFDRVLVRGAGEVMGEAVGLLGGGDTIVHERATIVRLPKPEGRTPVVDRDGTVWLVSLTDERARPAYPLRPESDPLDPVGPRVLVEAEDAERVIEFIDPDFNDKLIVVPLPIAGRGLPNAQRYPQVEFLPTAQGIAMRPLADDVVARLEPAGLVVTAPQGLTLSPYADSAAAREQDARRTEEEQSSDRLFDFDRWRLGQTVDFSDNREKLSRALAQVNPAERNRARMDLARFYFAFGLMQEAQGMLDLITQDVPALLGRSEYKAMHGAILAVQGQYKEALAELSDTRLDGIPEAALWRGYVNSMLGNHDVASVDLSVSAALLQTYPDPFRHPMTLAAAHTFAETSKTRTANDMINRLVSMTETDPRKDANLNMLRGTMALLAGDREGAKNFIRVAMQSRDRKVRVDAALKLTDLELEDKNLTTAQAAERFESLRFGWRGDDKELEILDRLGRYHVDNRNFVDGFSAWRAAISYFPNAPTAKRLASQMRQEFTDAFMDPEKSARMTPLEALSLFDGFRELVPVGARGDELILALTERLVQMDLLTQAADLLKHQAEFRMQGPDKARVATRLAGIRLLDNDPVQAVAALDMNKDDELSPALQRERRLLRARSLELLGRPTDALNLLENDATREAELLRVDIARRAKQWPAVADALSRLVPPPPREGGMPDADSRMVLNLAVALTLADRKDELEALRDRYAQPMSAGPDAAMFRVITQPDTVTTASDLTNVQQRLGELDMFTSFLNAYRTRQDAGAPVAPAATPAPAGPS